MMRWVGCLLTDSELIVLFAENSQIFLKISVIPILSTFNYLAAHNCHKHNHIIKNSQSAFVCHKYHPALGIERVFFEKNKKIIKTYKTARNCSMLLICFILLYLQIIYHIFHQVISLLFNTLFSLRHSKKQIDVLDNLICHLLEISSETFGIFKKVWYSIVWVWILPKESSKYLVNAFHRCCWHCRIGQDLFSHYLNMLKHQPHL